MWAASAPATAQTIIQYDEVAQDVQAAITCGFCATEKFGTIFYEVGAGGGLPASAFPFRLNNLQIAVASTEVTGGVLSGGYQCGGSTQGGTVDATLEVYAGTTVPTTITNLPASGAWPGETVIVVPGTVQLQKSVATAQGGTGFNVMINSLTVGATVPTPYRYLRVVITIPTGGASTACTDLGFQPPALSPFRDDNGRVGPRRNFIYQLGFPALGQPPEWTWVEDVTDPITMQRGINGDWLIRLDISPNGTLNPDAGVPADGGPVVVDTGVMEDAGVEPPADAGFADATAGEDAAIADVGPADVGPVDAGPSNQDPPTITDITPDQTAEGTAVSVTVVGTGFLEGVELEIGAIGAEEKLLSGSTTLVADVPMGIASGVYDVVVTNPDGQTAILSDGFTVTSTRSPGPGGGGGLGDASCTCERMSSASWSPSLLLGFGVVLAFRRRRRSRPRSHRA